MILWLLAGTIIGFLAGLLPFLHTNLLLQFLPAVPALEGSVFVVALAFAHLVSETLPAVFFALPSAGQSASVLPAQELSLRGEGAKALKLMLHGLFGGMAAALVLLPLAWFGVPLLYGAAKPLTWALLSGIVIASLWRDKEWKAAVVFALSGIFGFLVFSTPLLREPLFPLLTGLFGIPSLLNAMRGERKAPKQKDCKEVKVGIPLVAVGAIAGVFSPLLPALNPAFLSAAAFMALGEWSGEGFLVLSSSVMASKMVADFAGVSMLGKARSGAAAAVQELLGRPDAAQMGMMLGAAAFALCVSVAALLAAYRLFVGIRMGRKAYASLLVLIVLAVFAFEGTGGLFVCGVAAAIGVMPILSGTRRSYSMGALILPAILWSLGASLGVF
ncbi:hypothetical protein COT29_03670 [Candidatus Micrarchaeota archaeon CG08_land_8_20_14_0_20_59_11]|nr:MAG: hypothetical protein COT29_03670 [Candidatus Micrarchaeota archaeon CG08_land_8_20_14_0_20_59_11]